MIMLCSCWLRYTALLQRCCFLIRSCSYSCNTIAPQNVSFPNWFTTVRKYYPHFTEGELNGSQIKWPEQGQEPRCPVTVPPALLQRTCLKKSLLLEMTPSGFRAWFFQPRFGGSSSAGQCCGSSGQKVTELELQRSETELCCTVRSAVTHSDPSSCHCLNVGAASEATSHITATGFRVNDAQKRNSRLQGSAWCRDRTETEGRSSSRQNGRGGGWITEGNAH